MRENIGLKRSRPMKSLAGILAGACFVGLASHARGAAVTVAWDPGNPTQTPGGTPTAPTGSGGSGTWSNVAGNTDWSNSTADVAWIDNSTPTDTAILGGAAGTVTIGSSIVHTLGLVVQTTGYTVGASGGTNVLQVGATAVAVQPTIDTSALSGGSLTFNAPVDLAGVTGNAALDPVLNFGSSSVAFNGIRDQGVSSLLVTINGAANITLNNSVATAFGGAMAAPAAWVLSQTTSNRTWTFSAGTTSGANVTVNGRITNNSTATASTNNAITFQTGGTLTLTDNTSDANLTAGIKGWEILNNSTIALSTGDGANSTVGVLGNRTNLLLLGANSSSPSTSATLSLTAPLTLTNPISFSANSSVPVTILSSNNGTNNLNGIITNLVSVAVLTVKDAPTFTGTVNFGGTISTSSNTSNRVITFVGNAPITVSGVVQDGNGSTAGRITYSGSNTFTVASGGSLNENGATSITSGTMLVNGTSTSVTNTYQVSGTGTLGGTGSIAAAVSLIAGTGNTPTLAPGPGPSVSLFGNLTTASLVMGGNTTSVFQIDHTLASDANDELTTSTLAGAGATGAVAFAGILNVSDLGNLATTPSTTVFDLFKFASESGTFNTINLPTAPNGYVWHNFGGGVDFDYTTGDIQLDAVSVPEPASVSLLALGGIGLLRRRRRA